MDTLLRKAHAKGMHIILNPSPISPELLACPLELVDWFILNEVEGHAMTGAEEPADVPDALLSRFPGCRVVLTLGEKGAIFADSTTRIHQPAVAANVVDTTAAGDTFTGYFFASVLAGKDPAAALQMAAKAASLAIAKPGAARSIPWACEV